MRRGLSLQLVALRRARDLAGGVSLLARKMGIGAYMLDDMLHDKEPIPQWVFLRAVDFINEAEANDATPTGMPDDRQDPGSDASSR
jgi:hypothetical protein